MTTIRLLFRYLGRYRGRYLLGFFTLLGASVIVMLPPLILGRAIDAIRDESPSRWNLAAYGGVILALACVEGFLRFSARLLVSGTSRKLEYQLRTELAGHFMKMDQGFFLRSQTGDLMARCTNDLQMVRDLMGPTLIDLCRVGAMLAVGFVFLLTVNVRLALIAFAYFPVVAIVISAFSTVVENRYRAVQDQFGTLSTRVQENISGMRTIKAYAQEDVETEGFARENREMMRRSMNWAYYTAALWPLMVIGTGASTVLVLWFGGHDVASGKMSLGQFVQFNTYLILLAAPLMSLGWTVTSLQQGTASLKRIGEVLFTEPTITGPASPRALERIRGEVEFRHVSFSYTGEPVLRDLDLGIPAGTTVAIVGSTGAGKTTLVNLLARLWDPDEGQVLLDGVDVRELPLEQVRGAIGFVPQETFLFSDSLIDNIAYGRANPQAAEMDFALSTSQLVNDLPQLTHGLETVIGERGVTLSGGQKQRSALARAIIKDPPILVLDDALSHVDTHTEEEILRRLREFMATRTTIIVAHRTSTVSSADVIVALEDGHIVETGTHDELLAKQGVYWRLYTRQLLAEQVAEDEGAPEELLDVP
ncbi:MAG: ABC transporter ATP-binding protein [Chloroflexi bacterium]|nr:ABC transporter ATP-binding protein [Chloroflexota bacterium]